MTLDAANAIAVCVVGSRLDYFKSVHHGMSQAYIDKLQRVQNVLARIVAETLWTVSSMKIRRDCWHGQLYLLGIYTSTANILVTYVTS